MIRFVSLQRRSQAVLVGEDSNGAIVESSTFRAGVASKSSRCSNPCTIGTDDVIPTQPWPKQEGNVGQGRTSTRTLAAVLSVSKHRKRMPARQTQSSRYSFTSSKSSILWRSSLWIPTFTSVQRGARMTQSIGTTPPTPASNSVSPDLRSRPSPSSPIAF